MKFSLLGAGLLALVIFESHAIVNTETLRPDTDVEWKGAIGLSVEDSKGNTDKSSYGLEAGLGYFAEHETFFVGNYNYGESQDVKDVHNSFAHLRHNRQIYGPVWKWELFYQWQSDEFRRLGERQLFGTGLRTRLQKTETVAVYTGLGAFLYRENIGEEGVLQAYEEESARGNFYFTFKWYFLSQAEFLSVVYLQPRWNRLEDLQLLWDVLLSAPLTSKMSLNMTYSLSHDTRPPEEVEKTDRKVTAGLKYEFQ